MSNKNRIAVFAPEIHEPFIEGVQKAAWKVVNEIANSDTDVFLYTQKSYGTGIDQIHPRIRITYAFHIGKVKIIKYLRWALSSFSLARNVIHLQARHLLVFSLDWPFLPTLTILSFLRKINIRVIIFSTRETGSVGKFFLKLFGNRIETYFVSSLRIKEMLTELGIDDFRISFLPVHFTKHSHTTSTHIKRDPKNILYLSSAEEEAGIETMLSVAALLPDFTVTLAVRYFGDSVKDRREWLTNAITARGLRNVNLKQNLSNVKDELCVAGVVVLPPLTEDYSMALPLVLLEAFETDTPVITSNLPIFEFYKTSRYIQTFNTAEELACIISDFASSNNGCTMSKRAQDFVLNMTDTKEAAHIYIR